MQETDDRLDGNAAAGVLESIFPFEMTTARTICTGCGERRPIAVLAFHTHQMGMILRCPACDTALIRVVQAKGRFWLDLRGTVCLEIAET